MSSRKGWHLIFIEEKICSFFGHRDTKPTDELYEKTASAITKALELGYRTFYFGGYGSFDELCHKIVTNIKDESSELNIKRIYCISQERYLRKNVPYFNKNKIRTGGILSFILRCQPCLFFYNCYIEKSCPIRQEAYKAAFIFFYLIASFRYSRESFAIFSPSSRFAFAELFVNQCSLSERRERSTQSG